MKRRTKKQPKKRRYPKPSRELMELRLIHGELIELRKMVGLRLPLPLWSQTPSPGPSGTSKAYQQYVNPIPVAVVRMNELGDWVGEKKDGTVPPVPPRRWGDE